MAAILDQMDINEKPEANITYLDRDTLIIEDLNESPLILNEAPIEFIDMADPENPELVAIQSLFFDTVYHQLNIHEWIL